MALRGDEDASVIGVLNTRRAPASSATVMSDQLLLSACLFSPLSAPLLWRPESPTGLPETLGKHPYCVRRTAMTTHGGRPGAGWLVGWKPVEKRRLNGLKLVSVHTTTARSLQRHNSDGFFHLFMTVCPVLSHCEVM